MIKNILKPILMPFWWQDVLLLFPRFVYGFLLTSDFGSSKFGLPWSPENKNLGIFEVAAWFSEDVAKYGGIFTTFSLFFAWMGAFSEAIGGIFLMLGLLTRPFAFLVLCTMFVAIVFQQMNQGIWNMLPAMGIFWVSLYSLILGSGRVGLDFILSKYLKL